MAAKASRTTFDKFQDIRNENIKSIDQGKKKVWDIHVGERKFRNYSQITGCKMKSLDFLVPIFVFFFNQEQIYLFIYFIYLVALHHVPTQKN